MQPIIIPPPFNTETQLADEWGTPHKGRAEALSDKNDGWLFAAADADLESPSGAFARAGVGILELGPPTSTVQMQVVAPVDYDADWYIAMAGDPALATGYIALDIMDDTGAVVATDSEQIFNANADTGGTQNKQSRAIVTATAVVDPSHSYRAVVYAQVRASSAGWGRCSGSFAFAFITGRVVHIAYSY